MVCLPIEENALGKINLDYTLQSLKTQQVVNNLYEDHKDIFSLHQGDIGHTKLLSMDIDTGAPPYCTENVHITIETYSMGM